MPSISKIAVAALAIGLLATNAFAKKPYYSANHPVQHMGATVAPLNTPNPLSGTWKPTTVFPGTSPTTALLLTDGSVIVQDQCTANWYRLVPDATGLYDTGTWSAYAAGDGGKIAAMPGSYGPLYYASQVMPDGRVIVQGGEYENSLDGCASASWSNKGAVYNPYFDKWSILPPPTGWNNIGDAASAVLGPVPQSFTGGVLLESGPYMVQMPTGNCNGPPVTACGLNPALYQQQAILTALTPAANVAPPATLTPTWVITGNGKADNNDEEGWVLLPNGTLLTVDSDVFGTVPMLTPSELYSPYTNSWSTAGTLPVQLVDPTSNEQGPGVLTPYSTVFWAGAFTGVPANTSAGHTAIYHVGGGWTKGPDFPQVNGIYQENADGPAALLVSGNVLIQTSTVALSGPSKNESAAPSHFFEYNGATLPGTLTQVNEPNSAPNIASFQGRMLDLPTGQVLWNSDGSSGGTPVKCTGPSTPAGCNVDVEVYTPVGALIAPSWAPKILTISSAILVRGTSGYGLRGQLFSGISQGSGYGDDVQQYTNYPLVRITNIASGQICFGRTHTYTTLIFASTTLFDVPPAVTPAAGWPLYENPCDTSGGGASTLEVVTNGIPSNPIMVTIQ
jgi:hypothetical protein